MMISFDDRRLRRAALAGAAALSMFGATFSTLEPAQAQGAYVRAGGIGVLHHGYGRRRYGPTVGYGYRRYGWGGYGFRGSGWGPASAPGAGAGLAAVADEYDYAADPYAGGYDDQADDGYGAVPPIDASADRIYADDGADPEADDDLGRKVYARPRRHHGCGPYEQQTRIEKRACGR